MRKRIGKRDRIAEKEERGKDAERVREEGETTTRQGTIDELKAAPSSVEHHTLSLPAIYKGTAFIALAFAPIYSFERANCHLNGC